MLRRSRHPGPKLGAGQLADRLAGGLAPAGVPRRRSSCGRRPLLAEAVACLPAPVGEPLARFLTTLETAPLGQLQRDYVETFDVTRRCCLYLTYFTHGDTRKRGLALVEFKQAYRKAGVEFDADCRAARPPQRGPRVRRRRTTPRRRGGCSTPPCRYRDVANRLGGEWLPVARADARAAARPCPSSRARTRTRCSRLIAQGPPAEEVGLDLQPYAIDPRLNPRPTRDTVDLGRPSR